MQITFFYCVTMTILLAVCVISCDTVAISCDAKTVFVSFRATQVNTLFHRTCGTGFVVP